MASRHFAGLVLAALLGPAATLPGKTERIEFTREVLNLPVARKPLVTAADPDLALCPSLPEARRFGAIPNRRPDESSASVDHFLRFVVAYRPTQQAVLIVDFDDDGILECEESVPLLSHGSRQGKLFRTIVLGPNGPGDAESARRYRLVLPDRAGDPGGDFYEIEMVDAPVARWTVGGRATRWILFDGNFNGLHDRLLGDAVLIDWRGDGRIDVNPSADTFFSYHLPLVLPWGTYEVGDLDSAGRFLTLGRLPDDRAADLKPAGPGDIAARLECEDESGANVAFGGGTGRYQLIHFWISTCEICRLDMEVLVPLLRTVGPERLSAVGVSLDDSRVSFDRFVGDTRPTWPQCFLGAYVWDNTVARRLGISGPSDFVLVGPRGEILARDTGVKRLRSLLESDLPDWFASESAPPQRQSPAATKAPQK